MPELPEIETLKRSLAPRILGARVDRVRVVRHDVITRLDSRLRGNDNRRQDARAKELLQGDTIVKLRRHGKHLAIVGASGRVMCFHLGMSGQVRLIEEASACSEHPPVNGQVQRAQVTPDFEKHVHVVWELTRADTDPTIPLTPALSQRERVQKNGKPSAPSGERSLQMYFRDPRRFGGIWAAPDFETLARKRWSDLGPDALSITTVELRHALAPSHRPIKAALLDQSLLAGVGNIYADESLFRAGIHPLRHGARLSADEVARLADAIRAVLRAAIRGGGSSLRDYVNANGEAGRFVARHMVYGRSGEPCMRCGRALAHRVIGQRSSVFCARCQGSKVRHSVIHF